MEKDMKKCNSQKHKEINAVSYCQDCKLYMCNKCEKLHMELFDSLNHVSFKIDKDNQEILSIYCEEKGHLEKCKFFCKDHNKLCCAACICRIKDNENGQHFDCNVCYIKDIKKEKKSKLKENIEILEDISKNIEESINKVKAIYEQMNIKKEELQKKVQTIFTRIRNAVNNREDELLLEIKNIYDEKYITEESVREIEKLPNKIILSLEKGKLIDNEWDNDNKLNLIIKDCIDIENNIKSINIMKDDIKKYNNEDININFYPIEENEINNFLEKINAFGCIQEINFNICEISKIINNNKEYSESLKKWINDEKDIKLELLYRLSDNGDQLNKMHELCDNKGELLILYHINDGNKVGIYTPLILDSGAGWKEDMKTFIFNLNKNRNYKKLKKDFSLYCNSQCGLYTGYFGNTSSKKTMKKLCYNPKNNKKIFENGSEILENNGEPKEYDLLECEIFKIIFI